MLCLYLLLIVFQGVYKGEMKQIRGKCKFSEQIML